MTGFDRVHELLSYDPETGILRWRVDVSNVKAGSEAGCLANGYVQIRIDGNLYYAHRIAHLLMIGHWPEGNPEHENRIRHDNRWVNIRDLGTQHENNGNHGLSSHNTSGLKGVCWHKAGRKWMAHITFGNRLIYLGLFPDIRLAGLHYDAAAKIAWGLRFSCLNFPPEESEHIILLDRVLIKLGVLNA